MKRVLHILLLYVLTILGLEGCERNELPPLPSPVESLYYIQTLLNGEVLEWKVGEGEVIMIPEGGLSEGELPVLSLQVHKSNCEDLCPESIQMEFTGLGDYAIGQQFLEHYGLGSMDLTYPLSSEDGPIAQFFFDNIDGSLTTLPDTQQNLWNIEEETDIVTTFDGLFAFNFEGEASPMCQISGFGIMEGIPGSACNLGFELSMEQLMLSVETSGNNTLLNTFLNGQIAPIEVGSTTDLSAMENWIPGVSNVFTMSIGSSNQCLVEYSILINPLNQSSFRLGFDVGEFGQGVGYKNQQVSLVYMNHDGTVFQSFGDSEASFELNSIEPYTADLMGREAYTIKATGRIPLKSDAGDSIVFDFVDARIPLIWE